MAVENESFCPMTSELQTILDQLSGHAGWLPALIAWLFGAQSLAKLVQPRMTEMLTRLFSRVLETEGKDDDAKVVRVLASFRYWVASEILDILFRVKLPTLADFRRLSDKPTDYNSI